MSTPNQHQQQLSGATTGAAANVNVNAAYGAAANSFPGATTTSAHHGLSLLQGARSAADQHALSQLHAAQTQASGNHNIGNVNNLLEQNMNLVQRERLAAALMYEQQQQAAQVEAQLVRAFFILQPISCDKVLARGVPYVPWYDQ